MTDLGDVLAEYWPPRRISVTCNDCDTVLFDTINDEYRRSSRHRTVGEITMHIKKHRSETGHADVDIGIDAQPTEVDPLKEIDVEVTVGDIDD